MKGNFDSIINTEQPVLVDFFADWCQPCQVQAPIIQEVARELKDKVRVIKIDVDKNPTIAKKYEIQGVPTLALFKKGQVVWRQSGLQNKKQLISIIHSHS